MKKKCPVCNQGKPRRDCHLKGDETICSRCCAEMRGNPCGDCPHYIEALRHEAERWRANNLPDGHFIAEINPEAQDAVDAALDLALDERFDEAFEDMEKLVGEYPRNHDVCYGMGTLYGMAGNHGESVEWFKKAVAILPYFPEAHFNMAVAYQKICQLGSMAEAFRKAVEYGDPEEEYYQSAKSQLEHMAKVIMENEGVDLDSYIASSREFNRAFELMEERRWEAALDGFRAAIACHDRNAPTHGNMGLCLANLGHKADALAELDRALEIDPEYEPAMTNRLVVEQMVEGHPLEGVGFKAIEFSREKLERETR
ncbi:MAG: tetratricopeptide repeat protein [Verrucomicrobiota bacterium]